MREFTGATIVGVWEGGRFLPSRPDLELSPLSVPVAIGTPEQIAELDEVLVIYDANPNPVLIVGGSGWSSLARGSWTLLAGSKLPSG